MRGSNPTLLRQISLLPPFLAVDLDASASGPRTSVFVRCGTIGSRERELLSVTLTGEYEVVIGTKRLDRTVLGVVSPTQAA